MNRNLLKIALLAVLLLAGFFSLQFFDLNRLTPENIRSFVLSFGWWAPWLYILLYTIRPLFLFPAVLLTITGGMTFGPWWGTLYDLIGASLGAFLSFWLARVLGREAIERWLGKRLKKWDDQIADNGFKTILILRLVPLVPFDAVSYGGGLSKVRFREYAPATALGIIPGAFAYNYLGHSLHHVLSPSFFAGLGMVALLSFIPYLYKRMTNRQTDDRLILERRD